ncbi:MAG: acyl-CoA/acyl-ACP dehydrogenase [Myxococcales bacterium]|nr:acyl-CoA/acyl-ACP dehydrogenase [Myxococcales bacterium]
MLDGDLAGLFVVACRDGETTRLAVVEKGDGVGAEKLACIDGSRVLSRLELSQARAALLGDGGDEAAIEDLLDRAATLMAFEQLGGADRALAFMQGYVMDRYVFGRPVGSFQAIKHRLVDLFVDISLARSHGFYAAWALSTSSGKLSVAAAAARAAASEAFDLAARETVHMHGGIGFTWESECKLFYKRAKLLSLALGGPAEWRDKLVLRLAQQAA